MESLYSHVPSKPGVYLFKDEEGNILYVGKARDLKKRVSSYFSSKKLDTKTVKLVARVRKIDFIPTGSEIEAFLLEATLVKEHMPFYNIQLRDDKTYPYIKIVKNDKGIPYVYITRNTRDTKAEYFGPYTDVQSVRAVLSILRKIFPYYTTRENTKKKSLYDHLGLAPDATKNDENLERYKQNIKKLKAFLSGNTGGVTQMLKKEQKKYVEREEFEQAAHVQRQLEQIELITSEVFDPFQYVEKPDLVMERTRKEVRSLTRTLSKYGMDVGTLSRIECYDISNLQGLEATGSMVVLHNGEVAKSEYKRFKIRSKNTPDDYHMMKEVLARRLEHDEWKKPDLWVIDGGRGQVAAALEVLAQAKKQIPAIGLAKREEVIVIPQKIGHDIEFIEENLGKDDPGVNLLRKIRDEAHRFALAYHRLLRKKRFLAV